MDVITLSRPKALKALSDPELLDLKLKDVFVDWENMFTRSVFPTEHMGAARFPNAAITDDRQGEVSTTLAGARFNLRRRFDRSARPHRATARAEQGDYGRLVRRRVGRKKC
jgi:hypothetical protein